MPRSKKLNESKKNIDDEFYTQLIDIEDELKHYKHHFKDKIVYCNCDDPNFSNFFKYFCQNFKKLGLKKIISTCYKKEKGLYGEYRGDKIEIKELKGNGDFRSEECVNFLKQSDIIITNPPFSLFREYVDKIIEHNKKFLIIGNHISVSYYNMFNLIKRDKAWLGVNKTKNIYFKVNETTFIKSKSKKRIINKKMYVYITISWFTNLSHNKKIKELSLHMYYKGNESYYPKYDNYDAINVNRVNEIPKDYKGMMGVPITLMNKYNPRQFEIIKIERHFNIKDKAIFSRLIIRNKNPVVSK